MCGILGVVGRGWEAAFSREGLEAALGSLSHRGPDADGRVADEGAWLGHRRLSIIDLVGGSQPMRSSDRRGLLTYNGEVFNFAELAARHTLPLKTRSDTEVLLQLIRREGESVLGELRGMFAFAYVDLERESCLLARDPLGIKPLYYAVREGRLLFASEPTPLARVLGDVSLEPNAIIDYLQYAYVPEPRTVYREIRALRPGHFLRFASGKAEVVEYWRPSLATPVDEEEALERVQEAIRLSTVSDVPLASLLSGGIDSALIASVVGPGARYFNLAFDGQYDERERAAYTAEKVGVEPEFASGPMEIDEEKLHELLAVVGQPFGDTSLFACHALFEQIARSHKVCLSGDGADEVFSGYSTRRAALVDRAVRPLASLSGPAFRAAALRSLRPVLRRYYRHTGIDPSVLVDPSLMRDYEDLYWQDLLDDVRQCLAESDDVGNAVSYTQVRRNLPNDMLHKVDRASMFHSLEVRVPFLDHRVVEAGLRLPSRVKQSFSETKRPLRAWLASRGFSRDFLGAAKSGFGPPPSTWTECLPGGWSPHSEVQGLFTPAGQEQLEQSVYGRLLAGWERSIRL